MTTSKTAKSINITKFPVQYHERMTVEQVKGFVEPDEYEDIIVIGCNKDGAMTYLTSGMSLAEANLCLDRAKDFFLRPEDYTAVD